MILDNKRDSSPRIARGKAGAFALAAILLAALAFQAAPRLAFAQTTPVEAPTAEPPSTPSAPTAPLALATPAPAPQPALQAEAAPAAAGVAVIEASPQPGATVTLVSPGAGSSRGRIAVLGGLPPGKLWAAAPAPAPGDDSDDGAPRRKPRARGVAGTNDDLSRRLDRLEKMVESMKRDNEKRNFAFQFQDKFKPDFDLKFDPNQFAKIGKDAADQAQRAVEKARKDMEMRGQPGAMPERADDLKMARKSLEEQRLTLEKQMRTLEKQIQKLERAQQKIEEERNREENRRQRDDKRRDHDDDDTAKEKDEPRNAQ
jgi:hypothetical protein